MTRTPNPHIQRWNTKYNNSKISNGFLVDPLGEPELVAHQHLLDSAGLALEVACGKGQNALYLASLDYQVIACDGAYAGLEICSQSAQNLGLSLSALVCDLEQLELPSNTFSLVSVVRYLNRPLINRIKGAVLPGGLVFYKTFNTRFLLHKPNFNPQYVVKIGELNSLFCDFEILGSDSGSSLKVSEDATTSFILARRPME